MNNVATMPSRALLVRVARCEMRSVVNKARGKEDREVDDMVELVCWSFGKGKEGWMVMVDMG